MELYWIWFQELKKISSKEKLKIIEKYKDPKIIYNITNSNEYNLTEFKEIFFIISRQLSLEKSKIILHESNKLGIKIATYKRNNKMIAGNFVIYYKGELTNKKSIAIVGTRNISGSGYYYTEKICESLMNKEICINSGLAFGIDYEAHRYSYKHNNYTMAFLAHGLDMCYPKEHTAFMEKIAEKYAVVSPFPVGVKPFKYNFYKRNELLSLFSDEIIVVEASLKSGSLITANYAKNQGKKIWSIKGTDSLKCAGNNSLIKNNAEDYIVVNNIEKIDIKSNFIIKELTKSSLTTSDLAKKLKITTIDIENELINLELNRWINKKANKWQYNGW
ncbi:DNA-processing protein DprA [Helicovermis profundi]|uniref:DNA-processing protein DprA n=1 Tax=Helicovermis profundi TaxID=3065157 RepID=A0AAU9EL53_9FIRM|nr:DNA-processing protein DprA [Clostridia bacterium S502]